MVANAFQTCLDCARVYSGDTAGSEAASIDRCVGIDGWSIRCFEDGIATARSCRSGACGGRSDAPKMFGT